MKILRAASLALVCGALSVAYAQAPASQPPASQPLSAMVQPSISSLAQTMSTLRVDKWKLSNESRDQMNSYVTSINRDLNQTLPNLLADTDASHAAPAKVLEVSHNVNALYDVLLRVAATSEVAAPAQQAASIEQQVLALRDIRQALDDRIQRGVASQARTIADLQAQLAKANTAATQTHSDAQDCSSTTKKKPTKKK